MPKSLFKLIIFRGIKWILSACQTAYPRTLAMSGNSRGNLSTDKHQRSHDIDTFGKIFYGFPSECNTQIKPSCGSLSLTYHLNELSPNAIVLAVCSWQYLPKKHPNFRSSLIVLLWSLNEGSSGFSKASMSKSNWGTLINILSLTSHVWPHV